MSKILSQAVSSKDDGATWDFQCPGVAGSPCGADTPFSSTGWPTKKSATARGQQHLDEHKTGQQPMQTLHEFRRDQGLTVDSDGTVKVEDL